MDNFDGNKIESIFVVLVITEQCWSGTPALISNQNHKNEFKFILLHQFHFGRSQLLIVRGRGPLKRVYCYSSAKKVHLITLVVERESQKDFADTLAETLSSLSENAKSLQVK